MTASEVVDPAALVSEPPPLAKLGSLTPEMEALDPVPGEAILRDGTRLNIRRLKTRELFKLLRILTHGAGGFLQVLFQGDADDEEFIGKLSGLLIFAIPEAPEATLEFIQTMVEYPMVPGPFDRKGSPMTPEGKQQQAENSRIASMMSNPELDDLVSLVEAIITLEAADLQSLGKRLRGFLETAKKAGQIPTEVPSLATSLESST